MFVVSADPPEGWSGRSGEVRGGQVTSRWPVRDGTGTERVTRQGRRGVASREAPWARPGRAGTGPVVRCGAGRAASGDRRDRLPRDLELLVRRDHQHGDLGAVGGDDLGLLDPAGVALRIDLDAEALQPREGVEADDVVVLADAGGEGDDVDAAELGVVLADVALDAVVVDVEGGLD